MRFEQLVMAAAVALTFLGVRWSPAYAQSPTTLLVSATASLKDAFTEIGKHFEAQEHVKVAFNFGASSLLQRQIETGAPVDVFASAAETQMDQLQQKKLILPDTRKDFAGNTLVLVVPASSPLKKGSFADLATNKIPRIAIGAPGVPIRLYSEDVFKKLKLWDAVQPKCVFGENVRQVLDYVARGEVDAGLVYATDAVLLPGVRVLAIADASWSRPILYPVAVVSDTRQAALAKRFISYLSGKNGQKTLSKYGFILPKQ